MINPKSKPLFGELATDYVARNSANEMEPGMSEIEYLRIYTDADECSHFETLKMELAASVYAPPAPALNTSSPGDAEKCVFLELPVGWYGDWHPTPIRQWLVILSGEVEFEVGDGEHRNLKAGGLLMLEDLTGKGHQAKVIGNTPVRIAAIHCP